jgi:superfamily I DNA/RNA helicase
LLVEGGAGTGKTVLAATLAREHAALGKRVLLTCFNKALAQSLEHSLRDVPHLTVLPFHDLAQRLCQQAGVPYCIPSSSEAIGQFFREDSPELLLQAAETLPEVRFDSLIVDEAADFAPTWWIALEALGATGFSWCCFYDRQQCVFQREQEWQPPFTAVPMLLDTNLRNTRPIGELAAQLGRCAMPSAFRLEQGEAPVVQFSPHFESMAEQLRHLLKQLIAVQQLKPEQIVVLSPYKHTNALSAWAKGLEGFSISTQMVTPPPAHIRVGTVQGFKGLEADVVILAGLDQKITKHPELLYVGTSRARAALYVLALDVVIEIFNSKERL